MGQGTSERFVAKPWGMREGSACPVDLNGNRTTDPGVPSYHEPLPSYLCQETEVFSKWITAEEKRKFKSISMQLAALVDSPQSVFLGGTTPLLYIKTDQGEWGSL